jgi:hypothetical protein
MPARIHLDTQRWMATLQVPLRSEQVSRFKIQISRGLQRRWPKWQAIPKSKKANIKLKFKGFPKMTLIQVSSKSDLNRKAEGSYAPSSAKVMAKKNPTVIPKPPIPIQPHLCLHAKGCERAEVLLNVKESQVIVPTTAGRVVEVCCPPTYTKAARLIHHRYGYPAVPHSLIIWQSYSKLII